MTKVRRRFKHATSLDERLGDEVKRLRAKASLLSPGLERDELIRKARRAETAMHMNDWLTSPGLKPPT